MNHSKFITPSSILRSLFEIDRQKCLDSPPKVASMVDEFCRHYTDELLKDPARVSNATITASDLYEAYRSWMEEQGFAPASLPTFARQTSETGHFDKEKLAGRVLYRLKTGPTIQHAPA